MVPEQIPYALFYCLQFFILLLFVFRTSKVSIRFIDPQALIIAINITILIAALLAFWLPLIGFLTGHYSGLDDVRDTFASSFFGPFGFFAWTSLLGNVLLPQIMWIQKIRRSAIATYIWLICCWGFRLIDVLMFRYAVQTSTIGLFYGSSMLSGYQYYIGPWLIFLMVIVPIYFFTLLKKSTRSYS